MTTLAIDFPPLWGRAVLLHLPACFLSSCSTRHLAGDEFTIASGVTGDYI